MKEYIERKAVEKMFENAQIITYGEWCGYCTDDVNLDSIPAADVAPVRHGRWIFDHMTGEWSYYSYCSECGHQEFFANESVEKRHRYCYSCGALMDGKENDHAVN